MAGSRRPGAVCAHGNSSNVQDGTLCRAQSPKPGSLGAGVPFTPRNKARVLGFDGAKTHDFLFRVALSQIQWRDLCTDPRADVQPATQRHKALDCASVLYDGFLEACSKGPNQATAFLATQHDLQKKYLNQSQAILNSLQLEAAHNEAARVVLSRFAFGAQAVKSVATAGVAIIGLFLVGPEILSGAGIALTFDVGIELVNRLGPQNEADAKYVVVGFKQTVANDLVGVVGSERQLSLEATRDILKRTLSYPLKSSTFRTAASGAARLDIALKALGVLAAGVTLYTEGRTSWDSYKEMRKEESSEADLQSRH